MTDSPELDEFRRRIEELAGHKLIGRLVKRGEVHFKQLSLEDVAALMGDEAAYYFLIAAAGLNRTTLKKAVAHEEAQIVAPPNRKGTADEGHCQYERSLESTPSGIESRHR